MKISSEWSNIGGGVHTFTTKNVFIPSVEEAKLVPSGTGTNYGRSVAMNSDGSKCIVGGYGSKEVYIYAYDGTTWSQQTKLTPSGAGAYYGASLSMSSDGTKCIVGAYGSKEVYIYS